MREDTVIIDEGTNHLYTKDTATVAMVGCSSPDYTIYITQPSTAQCSILIYSPDYTLYITQPSTAQYSMHA